MFEQQLKDDWAVQYDAEKSPYPQQCFCTGKCKEPGGICPANPQPFPVLEEPE